MLIEIAVTSAPPLMHVAVTNLEEPIFDEKLSPDHFFTFGFGSLAISA